jgi:hypothetical protein
VIRILVFTLFSLLFAACGLFVREPIPQDDDCSAECGTIVDCEAAAKRIDELGCLEQWGVDGDDGRFLDLCHEAQTSGPGVCPALIARAATCEEADAVSECYDPDQVRPAADDGAGRATPGE